MADDEKARRGSKAVNDAEPDAGVTPGRGRAAADRPFDMWLQKQLHAMYDEIASEPLPRGLLNLIDRDAADAPAGPPAASPPGDEEKKS